ncbi:hypothetical protein Q0601_01110 [Paracoccus onubensis]|uniref:hypothetical protein n=1 Tax=Paracoccus onubensis TaxID=1675788 RepID=UPI00272FF7A5|nr:hypothetical protein [Paracoccus onubensis]MDP0925761.1 hypothetical protein [Paracoccus onubensis]
MVNRSSDLTRLERIARLKAERELGKFAAINAHMAAARQRVSAMRQTLEQSYRNRAPLSLPIARIETAQAGRVARELWMAEQDAERLKPGFERIRHAAMQEFGRAEVLKELARQETRAKKTQSL